MIPIHSVVTAKIVTIEPYGVFLKHEGESIFVALVNLQWPNQECIIEKLCHGDDFEVEIVGYDNHKQMNVGSRKHLRPEDNPYLALARRALGDRLRGTVGIVHKNGISVDVENCFGNLPYDDFSKELEVGDEVVVQVESVDPAREFLELRLAGSSKST